jgi:SOS response regulatory protein OraA/RecX
MLARRSYARAELGRRLGRNHSADEVDAALDRMAELALLDDREYACRFVRDRFERRGYGSVRIGGELRARGVAGSDVDAAIAEVIEPEHEREQAQAALDRYLSRHGDAPRSREGAYRYLVGRGFPDDVVRDLLGVCL